MVTVEPCIWILCGSRWASAAVREAIKDYTWLSNFTAAKVEVRVGGAVLANTAVPTDLEGLDYSYGLMLGPGSILYINVEDYSDSASLCGLVCCATVKHGHATMHRISRIGGLIRLDLKDDEPLSCGIPMTHGVLSNLLDDQERHDDLKDKNSSDDYASESEDGDTGVVVPRIPGARDNRPDTLDPKMFTKWRNHSLDIIAFQAAARAGKQLPSFRKYWCLKWKRHTEVLEQWLLSLSTTGGPAVVEETTSPSEEESWFSLSPVPVGVTYSDSTIAVSDDGSARLSKPWLRSGRDSVFNASDFGLSDSIKIISS
ncbi:hypothetical protein QBC42DRAFT_343293, partial [Cladorrhinum samala]